MRSRVTTVRGRGVAGKLLFCVAALVTVVGCNPNAGIISQAESAVRATLKDPESAVFKDVTVYSEGVVCGAVNSKNSYGAMAGYGNFVYGARFASDLEMDKDVEEVRSFCSNDSGKLIAYKKRELKSLQLWCEDPGGERGCERATALKVEISELEKQAASAVPITSTPPPVAAPAASAPSPVTIFGQVTLDQVVDTLAKCGEGRRTTASYPCAESELSDPSSTQPTTRIQLDPDLLPTWVHEPSFELVRDKASGRALALHADFKVGNRDESAKVVPAFRERFGEPQRSYTIDEYSLGEWALPNVYVKVWCSRTICTLSAQTPDKRRATVARIMANRASNPKRLQTP